MINRNELTKQEQKFLNNYWGKMAWEELYSSIDQAKENIIRIVNYSETELIDSEDLKINFEIEMEDLKINLENNKTTTISRDEYLEKIYDYLYVRCLNSASGILITNFMQIALDIFNVKSKFTKAWEYCNMLQDIGKISTLRKRGCPTLFAIGKRNLAEETIPSNIFVNYKPFVDYTTDYFINNDGKIELMYFKK